MWAVQVRNLDSATLDWSRWKMFLQRKQNELDSKKCQTTTQPHETPSPEPQTWFWFTYPHSTLKHLHWRSSLPRKRKKRNAEPNPRFPRHQKATPQFHKTRHDKTISKATQDERKCKSKKKTWHVIKPRKSTCISPTNLVACFQKTWQPRCKSIPRQGTSSNGLK